MQSTNYAEMYYKWTKGIRQSESKLNCIVRTNQITTYLFYIAYPILLVYVLFFKRVDLLKMIFVPGICFLALTFLRDRVNFDRPYDEWDITPLIEKESHGNSFPSRHVFSASLISILFLYEMGWVGRILLCFAFVNGVVRVLCGVHYPRDVIAGYILGILCGCVVFLV